MKDKENQKRFKNWSYPTIIDGELTKYNWVVQNLDGFDSYNKNFNFSFLVHFVQRLWH